MILPIAALLAMMIHESDTTTVAITFGSHSLHILQYANIKKKAPDKSPTEK